MSFYKQNNFWIALLIFIFGSMTVISGGRALFTETGIATRGNIVPLVLWFNFIAGFFYLMAALSTLKLKACIKKLSIVLAVLNGLVFLYLLNHIYQGGLYENRTLIAMSFRTAFWIFFAIYFNKSKMSKKLECSC